MRNSAMKSPAWFGQEWRISSMRIFLCSSLLFGCIFVFLIPPFQSPDEPNHFLRAYQISEGSFSPEKQDQRLGGTLPASLVQVRDSFSYLKMNYDARLDKGLIIRCLNIPLNARQRTFIDFPNTAIYAPTAYLPQAAAIALLRPFGTTPLQMLYATRLANLFVWVLLVLASIRTIPILKNTMAALALLPASLAVAASANADVVTNGFCWWLVAGFCAGNKAGLKNLLALVVVCANKLVTLPLVLLYWINAPFVKRTSTHRHIPDEKGQQFILLLTAAVTAALLWGNFAQEQFIPYDAYNPEFRNMQTLNEGVDPARQQAFILENPVHFAKIFVGSALTALPSTAAHFVGKFGWEKNYLTPGWLVLLWLTIAAIFVSAKNPLTTQQRLLALGVTIMFAVLFSATMYALWCRVGATEISNFQGRYFIPIAPVVALAATAGWLERFEGHIWKGTVLVLISSNIAMIISVLERYYEVH